VISTHATLLLAVHVHPLAVLTCTSSTPPSAGKLLLDGEIEYVQDGGGGEPAAACVTVNAPPAIVSVPVRAAPVFAATLNATEPFPVPEAPAVTVIQVALLAAVHPHVLAADTDTVPVPPAAATL
jgi:hypothetical protein